MVATRPIQTIESATRSDTGEVILASDLLKMDEAAFTRLRRATWPPTRRPDSPGPVLELRCTLCEAPLSLTRLRKHGQIKNRFFSHRAPADQDCPWLHRTRLSRSQQEALNYFRHHESETHRRLKNLIADLLCGDPLTESGSVVIDRFLIGAVLRGERKKPDVRAIWKGLPLVFELQLGTTFISEVVRRDYFYASEGLHLIWVFTSARSDLAAALDELHHNRGNLFALDAAAQAASIAAGRLILTCQYLRPSLDEQAMEIVDEVESCLVSLDELTFPTDDLRPFFIDGDVLREPLEARLDVLRGERQQAVEQRRQEALERQKALQHAMLNASPSLAFQPPALTSVPMSLTARSVVPARPPEPPVAPVQPTPRILEWAAQVDRPRAAKMGAIYLQMFPTTDWRVVYREAVAARQRGESVEKMIARCAASTGQTPGVLRNFLVTSTLAR